MMAKPWNQDSAGAMEELYDYLIRTGAPCSLCGQAFSKVNPPSITCHVFEFYGTDCYYTAQCYKAPFAYRHPQFPPPEPMPGHEMTEKEMEDAMTDEERAAAGLPTRWPPKAPEPNLQRIKYRWAYQNTPETGIRQLNSADMQLVCERPSEDVEEEGPEPGEPSVLP